MPLYHLHQCTYCTVRYCPKNLPIHLALESTKSSSSNRNNTSTTPPLSTATTVTTPRSSQHHLTSPPPSLYPVTADELDFYRQYDPMEGVTTAVVLGGFFVFVCLLVVYKTKLKPLWKERRRRLHNTPANRSAADMASSLSHLHKEGIRERK